MRVFIRTTTFAVLALTMSAALAAQAPPAGRAATPQSGNGTAAPPPVALPAGYVIGPEDILAVQFWKDVDLSAEVVVRPDGKISLQGINEVVAAGLTPDELRLRIVDAGTKLFKDPPVVNVQVKAIKSRNVSVQGAVMKPGPYPLLTTMRVVDLIAHAGGLQEFAKKDKMIVIRIEGGKQTTIKINYKDIEDGKNIDKYNIELKPGDSLIVPS